MATIRELEEKIRTFINTPRKHLAIFEDSAKFHKLCSCLDVIGDTELALRAYEEMPDSVQPGSSYILVYGFLQTLFVQQDAVSNLHEAFKVPYEPDPLLFEIRKIRNDAIGHPTERDRGKDKKKLQLHFTYVDQQIRVQLDDNRAKSGAPYVSSGESQGTPGHSARSVGEGLDGLASGIKKGRYGTSTTV